MKNLFFPLIIVALGSGLVYFLSEQKVPTSDSRMRTESPDLSALTEEYRDEAQRFSFQMPADYTVQEMAGDEETRTILVQKQGEGVQILISPFDEDITELTKERIERDIPDLEIRDAQPVEIGDSHTGLAFKSDNAAFRGASREVWFVFRGTLYQISTYESLDPLLQAIFATWKFF